MDDMVRKGRGRGGPKKPIKLSDGDVLAILEGLRQGRSTRSLAAEFHVSQPMVSQIGCGKKRQKLYLAFQDSLAA